MHIINEMVIHYPQFTVGGWFYEQLSKSIMDNPNDKNPVTPACFLTNESIMRLSADNEMDATNKQKYLQDQCFPQKLIYKLET